MMFSQHGDKQGQLVAIEENKDIPFHIKRVYYMYGTSSCVIRGKHAHKTLKQALICVRGSCKIKLDDGTKSTVIELDDPCEGIYVPNLIWREMFDFSPDAVLMVLASELYDKTDYIRDYREFLECVNIAKRNGIQG